jgi:5'-nucleotidase
VARLIAMRVLVGGLPGNTLLNVNVPPQPPRGIRMTRLGHRVYKEKIVEQADPRGRSHYWIGGGNARWDDLDGTDMGAVHDGYISLTPLHLDLTNHRALVQLADWQGGLNAQFRTETDRPARRGPAPVAAPKPAPAAATKRKPRRG